MLPAVVVSDLQGAERILPQDFSSNLNLVLFGFAHEQKDELHSWTVPLTQLVREARSLALYEIPVIDESSAALRTVIRNGMRQGTTDPLSRQRTFTLFVDKTKFTRSLAIQQTDHVMVALFDRDGRLVWEESGLFTPEKLAKLRTVLGIS